MYSTLLHGMVTDVFAAVKSSQMEDASMSPYYLAACILVPALWGLLASYFYDKLDARRQSKRPDSQPDPSSEMYHI